MCGLLALGEVNLTPFPVPSGCTVALKWNCTAWGLPAGFAACAVLSAVCVLPALADGVARRNG